MRDFVSIVCTTMLIFENKQRKVIAIIRNKRHAFHVELGLNESCNRDERYALAYIIRRHSWCQQYVANQPFLCMKCTKKTKTLAEFGEDTCYIVYESHRLITPDSNVIMLMRS